MIKGNSYFFKSIAIGLLNKKVSLAKETFYLEIFLLLKTPGIL